MRESWFATFQLAMCLYKDKKSVEADWILSDLILECQDDKIKVKALELNGHCLVKMNKYAQAMNTFKQAVQLASSLNVDHVDKLGIHFAMYKYAYEEQDWGYLYDLEYLILPWLSYFPVLLMEKEMIDTDSVKFVIEESIQEMKSYEAHEAEEAQNHLMFCNSIMITKFFKK